MSGRVCEDEWEGVCSLSLVVAGHVFQDGSATSERR